MKKIWERTARKEGFAISLTAFQIGPDLLLNVTGGDAHIGCVSLCHQSDCRHICSGKHKEKLAHELIASKLEKYWPGRIALVGGIHYPALSSNEIQICLDLCEKLGESLASYVAENFLTQGD